MRLCRRGGICPADMHLSSSFKIRRRIDIEERPSLGVKFAQLTFGNQPYMKRRVGSEMLKFDLMNSHHLLDNRKTASAVHRVRRLQSAFQPYYHNIGLVLQRNQVAHRLRIEKRHVTGGDEYVVGVSLAKSRIESAQTPAIRHEISKHRDIRLQRRAILRDDDTHVLENR